MEGNKTNSSLQDLYDIVGKGKNLELKFNDEFIKQINEKEEEIIKKEFLPALGEIIEQRLSEIKRELVLVVEYNPEKEQKVKVALTRKIKIQNIEGLKDITPHSKPISYLSVTPKHENEIPTKEIKNYTKGLKIVFDDGTIIWYPRAIDTYVEALRYIGFEKVSGLGIMVVHDTYNIVGKELRPIKDRQSWQHECDGWYIYSNISNSYKIKILQEISERLKVKFTVEECKPKSF